MTNSSISENIDPSLIIVKVGDREFRTAIKGKRQRFLPHNEGNAELTELMAEWERYRKIADDYSPCPRNIYTYNEMIMDLATGKWTLDEVLSHQTANGCTVVELSHCSLFWGMAIENPLWDWI